MSLLGQRSGGPKVWLAAEARTVLGTSPSPRGGCWLQESVTGCVKPWDPQRYLQSPKEPKTCLEWRTSHVVSDVWVTMSWSQGTGTTACLGPHRRPGQAGVPSGVFDSAGQRPVSRESEMERTLSTGRVSVVLTFSRADAAVRFSSGKWLFRPFHTVLRKEVTVCLH